MFRSLGRKTKRGGGKSIREGFAEVVPAGRDERVGVADQCQQCVADAGGTQQLRVDDPHSLGAPGLLSRLTCREHRAGQIGVQAGNDGADLGMQVTEVDDRQRRTVRGRQPRARRDGHLPAGRADAVGEVTSAGGHQRVDELCRLGV
jgi:hypothetical protein